jgi:hypothetical protein
MTTARTVAVGAAVVPPPVVSAHCDGSDNFTLQLTGNKTWFLSGPDGVRPDDRRRRRRDSARP